MGIFSLVLAALSIISIHTTSNLYITYAIFCVFGLVYVLRSASLFTYLMEIVPDNERASTAFVVYLLVNHIPKFMVVIAYYYTEDWRSLTAMIIVSISVAILVISMMPESPSFLYMKHRYDELRQAI